MQTSLGTGRVVVLHEFGGSDVLRIEREAIREPEDEEVRIKIQSIGLNRAEILWREGRYLVRASLPARIGFEAAGVVDAIGPKVEDFRTGERAGVIPGLFDVTKTGMYADYACVPARSLARTPENLTDEEAGAIWMAYLTAWGGLVEVAGIRPGEFVVIPAASSSVGLAAIQIVRDFGATPIALTTHLEKVERLKEVGALHVICSKTENTLERVKEITGDRGADIFFDPVTGELFPIEMECAAKRARIILYGLLDRRRVVLRQGAIPLLAKEIRVEGYMVLRITQEPELLRRAEKYILERLSSGVLKPVIAKTFRLEEVREAHDYMESNKQIGKVVMVP